MARSASALLAVAAALVLSSCVTTQQRNARAQLQADRLLASRKTQVVTRPSADVRVERVALVGDARATAVVVELTSASPRGLTDVPISVGVFRRGRRIVLNRRGGLDYFDTHVAAIAPRGRIAWVFTTRRRFARGTRAFARVGAGPARDGGLPRLAVDPLGPAAPALRVRVRNGSEIPQYTLPVYALARRGGRYVAAGRASVAHVGTRATATLRLTLVGRPRGATLALEALPTIYA